jgi:hypothetical protein
MSDHFEYGESTLRDSTAWDGDIMHACVCDSTWEVGLNKYNTQLSEYFGADCSMRKWMVICTLRVILSFFVHCIALHDCCSCVIQCYHI